MNTLALTLRLAHEDIVGRWIWPKDLMGCGRATHSTPSLTEARRRQQPSRLVGYDDLPDYLKENEDIRGYYRIEGPLRYVFLIVFAWHNENRLQVTLLKDLLDYIHMVQDDVNEMDVDAADPAAQVSIKQGKIWIHSDGEEFHGTLQSCVEGK